MQRLFGAASTRLGLGPSGARERIVKLGGDVTRVETQGQLVTSIIHPSHEFSRRYPSKEVADGDVSEMANINPEPPRSRFMKELPHHYRIEASGRSEGLVAVSSAGLETLETAPPAEYGGPGDRWSPETLLVAAVADCFILTFRAIARASSLPWVELRCEGEGELDRVERTTRFTGLTLRAFLTLPADADATKAERLLAKAEQSCLVTNSLVCPVTLESHVSVAS